MRPKRTFNSALMPMAVANFLAGLAMVAAWLFLNNYWYLIAAMLFFVSGVGVIFFARYLNKRFYGKSGL